MIPLEKGDRVRATHDLRYPDGHVPSGETGVVTNTRRGANQVRFRSGTQLNWMKQTRDVVRIRSLTGALTVRAHRVLDRMGYKLMDTLQRIVSPTR